MDQRKISRRNFTGLLAGSVSLAATGRLFAASGAAAVPIDVYKDPSCGCCSIWIEHMDANGYVSAIHHPADLNATKASLGIPPSLQSCHTAVTAQGYWFEGHVPARYVTRFLASPPANGIGLAVPGMPLGSPGMEVGDRFTPYDVMLLNKDGSTSVYVSIGSAAEQF